MRYMKVHQLEVLQCTILNSQSGMTSVDMSHSLTTKAYDFTQHHGLSRTLEIITLVKSMRIFNIL